MVGGLPLVGSAMGCCVGMVVDGISGLHAGFATLEVIGAAFCLGGCLFMAKEKPMNENETLRRRTSNGSEPECKLLCQTAKQKHGDA